MTVDSIVHDVLWLVGQMVLPGVFVLVFGVGVVVGGAIMLVRRLSGRMV